MHSVGYRLTPKEGAALPALLTAASGQAAPFSRPRNVRTHAYCDKLLGICGHLFSAQTH